MREIKFKNDRFKKTRGGYSRLLSIHCEKCSTHLFYYQKDGPGILKRMYLDRIYDDSSKYANLQTYPLKSLPQLICPNCQALLGIPFIYEKEKRPAFRLFVGSITKRIVKSR